MRPFGVIELNNGGHIERTLQQNLAVYDKLGLQFSASSVVLVTKDLSLNFDCHLFCLNAFVV